MTNIGNGADKAAKFRELATRRVSKIVKGIRQIGNLSSRGNYEYTPTQVSKIFQAMRDEMSAAEERFSRPAKSSPKEFSLD